MEREIKFRGYDAESREWRYGHYFHKTDTILCIASDEERRKITEDATERYQYLRKSGKTLPLLKFFNDDYVYIFLAKAVRGYGSHYIYNRKKNEGFLLKEGKPFFMYPCFGIVDNMLLAICQPDIVHKFVDRKFMSSEEIHKMEALKEDDNPVILKYYLKK